MIDISTCLLLIIAPILQIVLSVLRIRKKIKLALIVITALALMLGIALSLCVGWIFISCLSVNYKPVLDEGPGTISIYLTFLGLIINFITAPLIGFVCYIVWQYRKGLEEMKKKDGYPRQVENREY
ncbi:MAG: hypothetical protein V4592_03595 [Bacteroidota bacterium]